MMSLEQICEALETPLGNYEVYSDVDVVKARRAIVHRYSELTRTNPDLSWSVASLKARALWLNDAIQHGQAPGSLEFV